MTILGTSLPVVPSEEWMSLGVCNQVDPELFYPDHGQNPWAAKRICATCPVQAECLDYAFRTDDRFGVFGGLTEYERRKLRSPRSTPTPRDMNPRPCEYCGTVFVPWRDTARFCSKRCNLDNVNGKKRATILACKVCGKEFSSATGNTTYCSQECNMGDPKPGPELLFEPPPLRLVDCKACGMEFTTNKPRAKYCSDECRQLALATNAKERQRYRRRA